MTRYLLEDVPGIAQLYGLGHRKSSVFPDPSVSLPLQIHDAGFQEERGPSYNLDRIHRGDGGLAVILYTLSGRGRLRHANRQMTVEPGQLMSIYFSSNHRYWIGRGERWEYFYLTLSGREVVRHIGGIASRVGPVMTLATDSPILWRAAQACADALERKIGSPYEGFALANESLMELLSESRTRARSPRPPAPVVPAFLADVEEFCRECLARPIGVEDMARVANMSRFHFSRVFRKAWGVSPGRYLYLRRLEEAMRLVKAGGCTVGRIAEQCGFGNSSYFCKAFKKNFGVTPGRFRDESPLSRTHSLRTSDSPPDGLLMPQNQLGAGMGRSELTRGA
jgi:AraC-like DNA-binding protein